MEIATDRRPGSVAFDAVSCAANAQRLLTAIHSMSACRIAAVWMCLVLAGCNGSDLSGYRPLDKSGGSKSGETAPGADNPVDPGKANGTVNTVQESDPTTTSDSDAELPPVSALVPLNVIDGANVGSLLKVMPSAPVSAVAPAETPPSAAAELRKVEVLIPEKTFRADAASKALRVSYDDLDLLKVINMEPVTVDAVDRMPKWLKGLSGQRIKIRGFMYPTFETEGIERFVLARDNQICCFGRDPKIYDLVQIDMKAGKTTNYIPATRSFDVVGRLKIEMVSEGDKPYGLYFLEDAEVIDR